MGGVNAKLCVYLPRYIVCVRSQTISVKNNYNLTKIMKMRKLFTLLAMLGLAATISAEDVTFKAIDGDIQDTWGAGYNDWHNINTGTKWQANPGANTYVIFQAENESHDV